MAHHWVLTNLAGFQAKYIIQRQKLSTETKRPPDDYGRS